MALRGNPRKLLTRCLRLMTQHSRRTRPTLRRYEGRCLTAQFGSSRAVSERTALLPLTIGLVERCGEDEICDAIALDCRKDRIDERRHRDSGKRPRRNGQGANSTVSHLNASTVFTSTSNRVQGLTAFESPSGPYRGKQWLRTALCVVTARLGARKRGNRSSPATPNESAPKTGALPNFNRQTLTRRSWPPCPQGLSWRSLWVSPWASSPLGPPARGPPAAARSPGSRP